MERPHRRNHGPLDGTNLSVENPTANLILARTGRRHSIRHLGARNQQPIVHAGVRRPLRPPTDHRLDGHVRVPGQRERPRAVPAHVRTGRVVDAAEVALRSDAQTVVLVGQLATTGGVKVEALYSAADPGEVLKATLLGF